MSVLHTQVYKNTDPSRDYKCHYNGGCMYRHIVIQTVQGCTLSNIQDIVVIYVDL